MDEQTISPRQLILTVVALSIIVTASLVAKHVILGGLALTTLPASSGSALSGAVSQSLGTAGSSRNLVVEGVDYNLQNIQYYDNGQYVVASVQLLKTTTDTATIVLEQQASGTYHVVLGPGTAFSSNDTRALPADVVQGIEKNGALLYD